jgi:hypothetical protein
LPGAADILTVDAGQEPANKLNSEMNNIPPLVQDVASAVNGTDPINLVDGISSFVQTLKSFDGVVAQIAAVIELLCFASSSMLIRCLDSSLRSSSMVYPLFCCQGLAIALRGPHTLIHKLQMLIAQAELDGSVGALLSKMNEVHTFLTTAGLEAIQSMESTVENISYQTVQCTYFIQAYCGDQKFRKLT